MKACTNPNCRQNTFKVSFGPFARDERLPMVERVLGLLVESRYGVDRRAERLPEFGSEDREAAVVCLDLHPKRFGAGIFDDFRGKVYSDAHVSIGDVVSARLGTGRVADKARQHTRNHGPPEVLDAGQYHLRQRVVEVGDQSRMGAFGTAALNHPLPQVVLARPATQKADKYVKYNVYNK